MGGRDALQQSKGQIFLDDHATSKFKRSGTPDRSWKWSNLINCLFSFVKSSNCENELLLRIVLAMLVLLLLRLKMGLSPFKLAFFTPHIILRQPPLSPPPLQPPSLRRTSNSTLINHRQVQIISHCFHHCYTPSHNTTEFCLCLRLFVERCRSLSIDVALVWRRWDKRREKK